VKINGILKNNIIRFGKILTPMDLAPLVLYSFIRTNSVIKRQKKETIHVQSLNFKFNSRTYNSKEIKK